MLLRRVAQVCCALWLGVAARGHDLAQLEGEWRGVGTSVTQVSPRPLPRRTRRQ